MSAVILGHSHYDAGKKYCRRCEVFLYHKGTFYPCCGMALRTTPTARRDKEKLRQNQKLGLLLQRLMNEERPIVKALRRNIDEVNPKQIEAAKAFNKGRSGQ